MTVKNFWVQAYFKTCFSLGLLQNMFHKFLMYTNNFCFGYITVSCFFETFPIGRWVGWLENPISMKTQLSFLTRTLDFDLGFVNSTIKHLSSSTAKVCLLPICKYCSTQHGYWLQMFWIERFSAFFNSQKMVFGSRLITKHVS